MVSENMIVELVQLYGEMQPPNAEPLAVSALAAHLDSIDMKVSVNVRIVDPARLPGSLRGFVESIAEVSPDVVAISVPQGTLAIAKELLSEIRDRYGYRSPHIVLGNSLPASLPAEFLAISPAALIIRGWGEEPFERYLRQLIHGRVDRRRIPGASYLDDDGRLVCVPVSDDSPARVRAAPRRTGTVRQFSRRVESSRECRFGHCSFCTRPSGRRLPWTNIHRDVVVASIEGLAAMGETVFSFADEDFFGHTPADCLDIAVVSSGLGLRRFACSARVGSILAAGRARGRTGRSLLERIGDLGLSRLFVGIESLSDGQLRRYDKGITVAQALRAIEVLRRGSIDFELGFILFDPLVSPSEILENIANMRASGAWRNIGAQFGRMRLQINSPAVRSDLYRQMLRGIDLEYATYEWEFVSAQVRDIYHHAMEYWREFDYPYWLALNIDRASMGVGPQAESISRFIDKLRWLNLGLLEGVTEHVLRGDAVTARRLTQHATVQGRRLAARLSSRLEPSLGCEQPPEMHQLAGVLATREPCWHTHP